MKKKNPLLARLLFLVRVILTTAPFIWITVTVDFNVLSETLRNTAWWAIPVVSVSMLLSMFLQGLRWWILIHSVRKDIPFSRALRAHAQGLFYSIALPTSAAQDVVRATIISSKDSYHIIWGATWVARLFGLSTLALFSLVGAYVMKDSSLPQWIYTTIFVSCTLCFLLAVASFTKRFTRFLRPVVTAIIPTKIFTVLDSIRHSVYQYKSQPRSLILVAFITVVVQSLVIVNGVIALAGITGHWYFLECMFFIPAVEIIVISVPLTPNGVGLRESLWSLFLLHSIGLSPEQLTMYVAIGFLGILLRFLGGFALLSKDSPRR